MVVQNDRGATAQLPRVAAELGWGNYEEYALSRGATNLEWRRNVG